MATRDWRLDYVVCPHIAADENLTARHSGFRVCCQECADAGFLLARIRHATRPDGLCVGEVVRRAGA